MSDLSSHPHSRAQHLVLSKYVVTTGSKHLLVFDKQLTRVVPFQRNFMQFTRTVLLMLLSSASFYGRGY